MKNKSNTSFQDYIVVGIFCFISIFLFKDTLINDVFAQVQNLSLPEMNAATGLSDNDYGYFIDVSDTSHTAQGTGKVYPLTEVSTYIYNNPPTGSIGLTGTAGTDGYLAQWLNNGIVEGAVKLGAMTDAKLCAYDSASDSIVCNSEPGGASGSTVNTSYLTLTNHGSLDFERVLTPSEFILLPDTGANGTVTPTLDGTFTADKWCKVDPTGTYLDCTQNPPSTTTFSGGGGVLYFIPESFTVYGSLAISGTLDVNVPASISTNGGTLDYHVLAFTSGDSGFDNGAVREFNIPGDYVSSPQIQIYYMMENDASGNVEWEGELLCVAENTNLLNVKASVTTPDTVVDTIPAIIGHLGIATINLTDPGCSPGNLAFVLLSTDSDDATNDTATGLRYVKQVVFLYADE